MFHVGHVILFGCGKPAALGERGTDPFGRIVVLAHLQTSGLSLRCVFGEAAALFREVNPAQRAPHSSCRAHRELEGFDDSKVAVTD